MTVVEADGRAQGPGAMVRCGTVAAAGRQASNGVEVAVGEGVCVAVVVAVGVCVGECVAVAVGLWDDEGVVIVSWRIWVGEATAVLVTGWCVVVRKGTAVAPIDAGSE